MIIYVLLLVAIFVLSIRKRKEDDLSVLSIKDTTVVNGLCAILIFLSHSTQYWKLSSDFLDQSYRHIQNIHNQWVVAPFLAFSGYGVMLAIKNRKDYIRSYPYKRILKTLVNFDIAVLMYLIVALVIGVSYDALTVLGSFIGITSVGNSNWYIFAILMLYIFSYVAALISKEEYNKQLTIISALTILYIAVMWLLGFEMRYYSTVMCYPLGASIAIYKDRIIEIIRKYKIITLLIISIVIVVTYKLRYNAAIMNISSIAFVIATVWFLCYFEIRSRILLFFGEHAFSIFILQRLPGILLYNYVGEGFNKYIILAIDFAITIGAALLYDKWLYYIDERLICLFERKNNGIKI